MARTTIGIGLLLAALAAGPPPRAAEIAGPARAVDGDTLAVGPARIRLYGVDAPETGQMCGTAQGGDWDCGAAARARLGELVAGRRVRCGSIDHDRYGRVVARCSAEGVDLGGALIAEGLAWAYVRYSSDYVDAEARARALGRGLWQGPAQAAWDYRAGGFVEASGGGDLDCVIKGNINAAGEKIYHLPASPWYDAVVIDQSRGQRWFCDEAEAQAAGWRAARSH